MTKAWHISDVHLSMDKDFNPIKRMDERRWSKGCSAFSGYLEKMVEFAQQNISPTDITFITGDIVHDMKEAQIRASLQWLRLKIPGTIVLCRGNHDRYWNVASVRQSIQYTLQDMHLIDEGEIITIGPYTIGCYSNHSEKTSDWTVSDPRYIEMAQQIGRQAKEKNKKAVMLSHYPLNPESAEAVGKAGIHAYMSGHVHCTNNNQGIPDCAEWDWYSKSAGLTDDKVINGCFFSTGTVDVLINKHKQPYKHIECLDSFIIDHQELNRFKGEACKIFKCEGKLITKFDKIDPFNPENSLTGFLCREKGDMQGSLYITHVNGKMVEPQVIYGTPKLAYPYINDSSRQFKLFPTAESYFFADKWNGMNVLVYKYKDASGKTFATAKSKGTTFLADSEYGKFLTLTKKALAKNGIDHIKKLLRHYEFTDNIQSLSFELCGKEEPHLVDYNFDLELKPLFKTTNSGDIIPLEAKLTPYSCSDNLVRECIAIQKADFACNVEFRKQRNLPHKYEYNHFAVEGKVLYLLDNNGFLIDRTMYKIKPEDIEDVHWETFGKTMQGRVREAVEKIKTDGNGQVTEENMKLELDMGPKEWGKFGRVVMQYIRAGEQRNAEVLILCGIPGSGKSTIAKLLENHGYIRINQDELGSRNACKKLMEIALKEDKNVVIDRCNFDLRQRKSWIDLAHEHGVSKIRAAYIDIPKEVALERAKARTNHETIKDPETAEKAVNAISGIFTLPTKEEGFIDVIKVEHNQEPEMIVTNILVSGK